MSDETDITTEEFAAMWDEADPAEIERLSRWVRRQTFGNQSVAWWSQMAAVADALDRYEVLARQARRLSAGPAKLLVCDALEKACTFSHPVTHSRPWLWLGLPYCTLGRLGFWLEERWGLS